MRFDFNLRAMVRSRLAEVAGEMSAWEDSAKLDDEATRRLRESIRFFDHTTMTTPLQCAGVHGSGDFPALAYGDSFVYLTVAQGTVYAADSTHGLREVDLQLSALFDAFWIPASEQRRTAAWDATFARLCGMSVRDVVAVSDYQDLKHKFSGRRTSVDQLVDRLIRPNASDSSNVAIQLRTVAELAMALRLLQRDGQALSSYRMLIFDSTLTLPLVTRRDVSLFYEHLKRLCCVEARRRGVILLGLSKFHGLPGIECIEDAVRDIVGGSGIEAPEHWYLKVPAQEADGWTLPSTDGHRIPPAGAVTYLVRFHRNVPVLRVDLDANYWNDHLRSDEQERLLFQSLDYCAHDQRCYGYPYPVKAGRDRASLTEAERVALRKQLIDESVRAGLKRSLFRNASLATGMLR
jgi:hypothetical protein